MDKIHIKDLEIIGFHGAIPEEKVLGQKPKKRLSNENY